MNTFNRKASFVASLLAFGLFGALSVNAAEASAAAGTGTSCHQVTHRVAVWPVGGNPKIQQIPRFESRTLTVCDHDKAMAKTARSASSVTFGPRQR